MKQISSLLLPTLLLIPSAVFAASKEQPQDADIIQAAREERAAYKIFDIARIIKGHINRTGDDWKNIGNPIQREYYKNLQEQEEQTQAVHQQSREHLLNLVQQAFPPKPGDSCHERVWRATLADSKTIVDPSEKFSHLQKTMDGCRAERQRKIDWKKQFNKYE